MNPFKILVHNFFKNFAAVFRLRNLVWHALATVLTFIIVRSDFDWWWFTHLQPLWWLAVPAVFAGIALPFLVPIGLMVYGWIRRSTRAIFLAGVLGQAGILGDIVASIYKAFTGRKPPEFMHGTGAFNVVVPHTGDYSHGFQFGFLRGGVFWGWPSSHTTVAFAMSVALIMLFPKNALVRWLALLYAFYIGLGVSFTIHWFSEFVAGAIIGAVIGYVVGKAFQSFKIDAAPKIK